MMRETYNPIVRTEDQEEHGLVHRFLFGLNLFNYNDVPCPIGQRPDALFLRSATVRARCSAQVGAMYLKDL